MKNNSATNTNKYKYIMVFTVLMLFASIVFFLFDKFNDFSSGLHARTTPVTGNQNLKILQKLDSEIERLKDDRSALENSYSDMKEQVAALQSKLAEHKQSQKSETSKANTEALLSKNTPPESETAKTKPDKQYDPELEDQQASVRMMAQSDLLEDVIAGEEIDPEWSIWAEESMLKTFEGDQARGLFVVDLDCRTSLCRMELTLDGSASPEESFRNLSLLAPWEGQGFVRISGIEDEGGQPNAIVYLTREGYVLPQYEPE